MKKIILHIIAVTALLFTWSGYLFAQTGTIEGIVREGPEGNINIGFNITFQGPPDSEITTYNSVGRYTVSAPIESTITLVVSLEGYPDLEKSLTVGSGIHFMNFWFNPPDLPSDYDGNYYNIVEIGTQTWMVENLKVTHFRDNTNIPNVTDVDNTIWPYLASPAYCWYENDAITYKDIYGGLYNWHTVNTGNLCPYGWHVPSDEEWTVLTDFLGGINVAGGKMKEIGTTHWESPNTGATNESYFTGLPGGSRNFNGLFFDLGLHGHWWSNTGHSDPEWAWARVLNYENTDAIRADYGNTYHKTEGLSVRCIQNSSGQTIVINTNNAGYGSLRDAIEYTNSTFGVKETITFNIPGTGPFIIQPETQLPAITDPVVIDGYSQPGSKPATDSEPATIPIEINGSAMGSATGLNLDAGNSTISGLSIKYFDVNMSIRGNGNTLI